MSSPSLISDLIQFWSPLTMSKVVPLHHQRGWAADVPWTSELCSLLQLQPPLLGLVRQEGQQKCGYQHFSRGVSLFRFLGCNYHTACIIYDLIYCIIYHISLYIYIERSPQCGLFRSARRQVPHWSWRVSGEDNQALISSNCHHIINILSYHQILII